MRTALIETLVTLANKDERIFLLIGDIGWGAIEPFKEKFPNRFLNCGVAEQNMLGMAAGLALSGKIPVVYSIATFVTLRPLEFIRNDVCYQNLNVKIVGVGSGFSYPQYALTHQAIDDLAIMRNLANLTILNPGDPLEVQKATIAAINYKGPVYLRIGKKGEPVVHKNDFAFSIGKAILLEKGGDLTVFATGNILENTAKAVEILKKSGFSVRFISMPTIQPLDKNVICKAALETKNIFSVEENFIVGGLGTAIAEVLMENGVANVKFQKIAIPHKYPSEIGTQNYMRNIYGLTPQKIAGKILNFMR